MYGDWNEEPFAFDHDRSRAVPRRPMRPACCDPAYAYGDDSGRLWRTGFKTRGLFVLAVGLLAWMLAGRLLGPPSGVTSAPSVEQLRPLAALMTHRVVVVDAITSVVSGYTGDVRAAVVLRGDAMLSVDLMQARIAEVHQIERTAVIVLPPPHVLSARVDHEATRIFNVEASGLWALVPSDEVRALIIDQAMRVAQQAVMKAASEPLVMDEARTRAEALITEFFRDSLDWSVTVCWADVPGVR